MIPPLDESGFLEDNAVAIAEVAVIILAVLTVYLIIVSVWVRVNNLRTERRIDQTKERLYPFIFAFMEEGKSREVVVEQIKNEEDLIVLEEMIFEYMDLLDGKEIITLQELLAVPRLLDYRQKQLYSRDSEDQVQACYYFRNLSEQSAEVQKRLFKLLNHSETLVIHSAAVALLANSDVHVRERTFRYIARHYAFSRMAMLELMHEFIQQDSDQLEEEEEALKRLMQDPNINARNLAVIAECIADINFYMLADYIYDFYLNHQRTDPEGELRQSLIYVLGRFEYLSAAESIARQQADSRYEGIRKASAFALGRMNATDYLDVLEKLARDPVFSVQIEAVKALARCGDSGVQMLKQLTEQEGHLQFIANDMLNRLNKRNVTEAA